MKKFKKIISLLIVCIVFISICFTLNACGNEPGPTNPNPGIEQPGEESGYKGFILNEVYGHNTLHTEVQKEYLNGNFANVSDFADGTKELSKSDKVSIYWKTDYPVNYYKFYISENQDFTNSKQYNVNAEFIDLINLKVNTKYYYKIVATCDNENYTSDTFSFVTENLLPRNLDIDGVTNVRDLGGYSLPNDMQVKQGMLFRAGRLNLSGTNEVVVEITEDGKNQLVNELGVKTEIDLRASKYERGGIDQSVLGENINYYVVPMVWEISQGNLYTENKESIKLFFDYLADESNYPIIFHCNIGTDRTGLLSYLLNGMLGVSDTDLYKDYLFSNFGKIGGARALGGVTSYGDYIQSNFEGNTRSEKIYNALLACGVSSENLNKIKSLMTEDAVVNLQDSSVEKTNSVNFDISANEIVMYSGEEKSFTVTDNYAVQWFSTDVSVFTVTAEGVVKAKNEGQACLIARSYNYRTNANVRVYPANAELYDLGVSYFFKNEEERLTVDLSSVDDIGNIVSIKIDNLLIEDYELSNKVLTIPNSFFIDNKIYGEKNLEIISNVINGEIVEKINYINKEIIVVTAKISTASDIDNIGALSKQEETEAFLWGGYFLLTNDIQYNKQYSHFVTWDILNANNKAVNYNTGKGVGFKGVIDGNGYNIEGFAVDVASNGLVGVLETEGVVKNISFTKAKVGSASSLICTTGNGLIENVYVECIEQLQGWGVNGDQKSGMFFSSKSSENATIRNCFVVTDVSNVALTSESRLSPLAIGTVKNIENLQNVYCIVNGVYANTDCNYLGTVVLGAGTYKNNKEVTIYQNNDKYGAYASKESLLQQNVDFSKWDSSFWTVKNGLPIPLNIKQNEDKIKYTVNHYLYKTTNENDGYYLYSTENLLGILGESTNAKALALNNYTAKAFNNSVIGNDTVVAIYYNRNSMLIESFDGIKSNGWGTPVHATKLNDDNGNPFNVIVSNVSGLKYSVIQEKGNGVLKLDNVNKNGTTGTWIGLVLTVEQYEAIQTGGSLSFDIKSSIAGTYTENKTARTVNIGTGWQTITLNKTECNSVFPTANATYGQYVYYMYNLPANSTIFIDNVVVLSNGN